MIDYEAICRLDTSIASIEQELTAVIDAAKGLNPRETSVPVRQLHIIGGLAVQSADMVMQQRLDEINSIFSGLAKRDQMTRKMREIIKTVIERGELNLPHPEQEVYTEIRDLSQEELAPIQVAITFMQPAGMGTTVSQNEEIHYLMSPEPISGDTMTARPYMLSAGIEYNPSIPEQPVLFVNPLGGVLNGSGTFCEHIALSGVQSIRIFSELQAEPQ
jgi:hypothetical protein